MNFDNWVADISSKYSVEIFRNTPENVKLGCVSIRESIDYAKSLKIPFITFITSSEEEKEVCKKLNEIVGVKGFIASPSGCKPL